MVAQKYARRELTIRSPPMRAQQMAVRRPAISAANQTLDIASATIIDDMDPDISTSTVVKNLTVRHAIVLGDTRSKVIDKAIIFITDPSVQRVNVRKLRNATVLARGGALITRG